MTVTDWTGWGSASRQNAERDARSGVGQRLLLATVQSLNGLGRGEAPAASNAIGATPAPRELDGETRARVVRRHGESKLGARQHVGALLDINVATLRNWIEADERAARPATASETAAGEAVAELRRLRGENAELRRDLDGFGRRVGRTPRPGSGHWCRDTRRWSGFHLAATVAAFPSGDPDLRTGRRVPPRPTDFWDIVCFGKRQRARVARPKHRARLG